MSLPWDYPRAKFTPKTIYKAAPTFTVDPYFDDGTTARAPFIPEKVTFGPDLYNFLRDMQAYAASKNEDVKYEGHVGKRPTARTGARYAYYGYGPKVGNMPGDENEIGIIGYGDTERPDRDYGTLFDSFHVGGVPNYQFSQMIEEPYFDNDSKSLALTNILNKSRDFTPLFGPYYNYTDLLFEPDPNDPSKKPATTDHWIPRIDKRTLEVMRRPDGRIVMMPAPLVMQTPIYNFNHNAWREDPVKAWNMIDASDVGSQYNFKDWGVVPQYARYDGNIDRRSSKNVDLEGYAPPKMLDYYEYNAKLANKPDSGYFIDTPFKSSSANYKQVLRDEAMNETIDDWQKSLSADEKKNLEHNLYSRVMTTQDGTFSTRRTPQQVRQGYKGFINLLLKHDDYDKIRTSNNISKEDKPAILNMVLANVEKYGQMADAKAKGVAILKDYAASGGRSKWGNIEDTVKGGTDEASQKTETKEAENTN